jgi:ankyrin repeat protein
MSRHTERHHSANNTIRFASPRGMKQKPPDIFSAAAKGNLAEVEACLLAGVSVNAFKPRSTGKSPLLCATEMGHIRICRFLLEQGADVNFQETRGLGRTPLHAAALTNDSELIRLLLCQHNVDPSLQDTHGFTAAGISASHGCMEALTTFISKGFASHRDSRGRTCLTITLHSGNPEVTRLILNDAFYEIDGQSQPGQTPIFPLHITARAGLIEEIKILSSSGRINVDEIDLAGLKLPSFNPGSETLTACHRYFGRSRMGFLMRR